MWLTRFQLVDYAFFGKLVLILLEHKWRLTETLPVLSKWGHDVWIVKSVVDMVQRTGLQRLIFKSDQEPSILDLKNKVVAELCVSYDVFMETSSLNERRSNCVVERALDSWRHDPNSQAGASR